jgi:CHAD domain-containing protein
MLQSAVSHIERAHMAFCLKRDERVDDGFRRLARKQLRDAAAALRRRRPDDEAIHEARKSLKKARAIARLIDADRGSGLDRSSRRMRKINRMLSRLRDADAVFQALDRLRREHGGLIDGKCAAALRRRLRARKRKILAHVHGGDGIRATREHLDKLRRAAKGWRAAHAHFGAMEPGVRQTFRRGQKAMRRALETRRATDFHEWRKQIKALWYALRLVQNGSAALQREIDVLHRAQAWLGEDHNIVVLFDALVDGDRAADDAVLTRVRQAGQRSQYDLRRKTVAAVRRVYSRDARVFVRGVRRAWKDRQRKAL